MHIYALDEKDQIIAAHQADKQKNYYCLECQSHVRRRGGFLKQVHYYHIEPNRLCRQSGKTLAHLQVQSYIQKMFPSCELEKRFPTIQRIADACVEEERLVFEVQCSPISAKEVEERNRAYQSLGYQVVWILHDQLYNKNRLTAAEYFLQESPHYFTDINEEGRGRIYDQWDVIHKGNRLLLIGAREVFLSSPIKRHKNSFPFKTNPLWMGRRIKSWAVCFSGDYLDFFMNSSEADRESFILEVGRKEKELLGDEALLPLENLRFRDKMRGMLEMVTKVPYRLALNIILEKLTR